MPDLPAVGSFVQFREDTPQYAANKDITYRVVESPHGSTHSIDSEGRPYLWLEDAADVAKSPSRRRRRTGYADALVVVTDATGAAPAGP